MLVFAFSFLNAVVNDTAGIIFPELASGAGARADGMGGAFTSVADDASAVYWNPAGLSGIKNIKVSAAFDKWLMDSFYQNIMAAFPMGPGVIGFDVFYMSYGSFDRVNDLGILTGGTVAPYNLSFTGAYGLSLGSELSAGLSARFAMLSLDTNSFTGLAVDLGALYRTKSFSAGIALKNAGTGGDYYMPFEIKAGFSMPALATKEHKIIIALDTGYVLKEAPYAAAGAEYSFSKMFFARAGYKLKFTGTPEGSLGGLTLGAGAGLGAFSVDYAFVPFGDLGATHRVALNMEFAPPSQEVEMLKPVMRSTAKTADKKTKTPEELLDMLAQGGSFENAGNLDAAEKQYRAILDEDFNYADAWKRLGAVMVKKKNNVEAFRCFQAYLKLRPNDKAVKAWIDKNSRE